MISHLPLAATTGCLAGVGLDVCLETYEHRLHDNVPPFYVVGAPEAIDARRRRLGISCHLIECAPEDSCTAFERGLPVFPLALDTPVLPDTPGVPTPAHADAVIHSIEIAFSHVRDGRALALVTNPIQKESLYRAGFAYKGHTEFIADLCQKFLKTPVYPVMMMTCPVLRTVPLTIHVSLREALTLLTPERVITTAQIVAHDLERRFGIPNPRLVLAGINPHAGEGGTMGTEDQEILIPACKRLQEEGLAIRGPLPADTLFHARARAGYDCALAAYHDQALIPIKTLAFDKTVNVTLGLPVIRTSPAHGTALDIAGTGRACPDSFKAALILAAQLGREE